jgi:hypothetical protein
MDDDIITGVVVFIVTIVLLATLVVWSVRIINQIGRKGCHTSRETLKELAGGR